jgi:hypothetical protein
MKKALEARDTIFAIADFFHAAAHKEGLAVAKGMTVAELARRVGKPAPLSLRGATVRSVSTRLPARTSRRALLVEYEQLRRGDGAVGFKKCVTVDTWKGGRVTGSATICIDCSIRKLKCTISIVVIGTIVIG